MIKDLHIKNYRLFEDFEMKDLAQVNLIAGRNNTGKTALLEALRILESHGDNTVVNNIIHERGQFVPGWYSSFDSIFNRSLLFSSQFDTPHISEINGIRINREYFQTGVEGGSYEYHLHDIGNDSNRDNGKKPRLLNPNVSPEFPKDQVVFVPFLNGKTFLQKRWEQIALTPLEDQVLEVMQIVEPKIIRLDVLESGAKVRLKDEPNPVPLKNLGDGVNRALFVAIALVSAKNKMLLLDEFEAGLHQSVQEKLWEIIFSHAKTWNIQVFATTHSMDAVRTFFYATRKPGNEGMGKFFRLQKSRKGAIEAIPFDEESLELAMETNLEIR